MAQGVGRGPAAPEYCSCLHLEEIEVGSHRNRCFWTWRGGVPVHLLLIARCSCRGGCSLFRPWWKEKNTLGSVVAGHNCSWTLPLPFLGCIKCAAHCGAKIVEAVFHQDRSQECTRQEARRGGGHLPGLEEAILLASSPWPSLLENVAARRCPDAHTGLWAVSGWSPGDWQETQP